jgi:toxin-antitoxin system PIN domain toxin
VILCDTNFWLALSLSKHIHHSAVRDWLETIEEPLSVLFCRATQQSFLRLLTNASVLSPYGNPPLSNREAWSVYEKLLSDDRVDWVEEPDGVESLWKGLAMRPTASPG